MGHHPHPHPRHGLCPCLATSHFLSRGTTRTPPAPRWTLTAQWYGLATHLSRRPSLPRSYQIRVAYLSSHQIPLPPDQRHMCRLDCPPGIPNLLAQQASPLHRMRMDLEPAAAVPCYSCRLAQIKLLPHIGLFLQGPIRNTFRAPSEHVFRTQRPFHFQSASCLSSHKQGLLSMCTSMKPCPRMRMNLEPAAAVPCYSCRLAQTMKDPGKARPL